LKWLAPVVIAAKLLGEIAAPARYKNLNFIEIV
jgi:hypothetical protein